MIIGPVRLSYLKAFEPEPDDNGRMKYSCCIMIPDASKKILTDVNSGVQAAIEKGLEGGNFPKSRVKGLKLPLRDGNEEVEQGKKGPEYKNMQFMNASRFAKNGPPGVINRDHQKILDPEEVYSGIWAAVDINFFPFPTKNAPASARKNYGIGVGLNNIMKLKDDDRLDGRMAAEEAFADYDTGDDEEQAF